MIQSIHSVDRMNIFILYQSSKGHIQTSQLAQSFSIKIEIFGKQEAFTLRMNIKI